MTATPLGVRGKANGPIELLSLSLTVSYADLDLTRPAGLRELERRVRLAARSACDEITFEYPEAFFPPTPRSEHCEQDAVASAMSQVRGIIAARGGQTWLATGEPTR